ncbi:MAG TPA: NmrA family NAD(P)-binding protein, partial [Thermoanaerobaculia bacterium]|nr:NmrA family NAD(P)-binding protein [Thermoanaerobaculia bacterium]
MSERRKIIAVVGATGAQGGGLARAIAADRSGACAGRAITRNPDSEKAKALAALGLEVVAADLDDEKSLERAFAGAHGVYCVTNFWEHLSPEKELVQAGNMARAAKSAGASHVVWSTLEDTRRKIPLDDPRLPTLRGKYKVPHFDAKGEADAFFAGLPATYLLPAWYFENLIYFGSGPRKTPDGGLVLAIPLGGGRLP